MINHKKINFLYKFSAENFKTIFHIYLIYILFQDLFLKIYNFGRGLYIRHCDNYILDRIYTLYFFLYYKVAVNDTVTILFLHPI
jgi:hypothetical protein